MTQTTRRGFLACLSGLAVALLAPVRLLAAAKSAPVPEPALPHVQPFRALVNGEMFNLHWLGGLNASGRADSQHRAALADAAAYRFGFGGQLWRQLRFVERIRRDGAAIPSYAWC